MNIPIKIVHSACPNGGSSSWYRKHGIIEAEIKDNYEYPVYHAAIMARNVEQIIFGLSSTLEVVSIELIGVDFRTSSSLKSPSNLEIGNLCIKKRGEDDLRNLNEDHQALVYDFNDEKLNLMTNMTHTAFRVQFGQFKKITYYSPCRHVMFGVEDSNLKELWITATKESKMR